MKTKVILSVLGGLLFIAFLAYLSFKGDDVRVEVCVTYQGSQACRTARGTSFEQAQRAAQENACTFVASGMTDSIACQNATPDSVRRLN